MSTSTIADDRIRHVAIDAEYLTVELMDGRRVGTPLAWYPRLAAATPPQLNDGEIISAGRGLHWEQLDEDLSVEGMLRACPAAGYPSASTRQP
ncbi:DUF2442 domain-containing protein [Rugamonas apoptosis]|uniref:DUF2442 domain-containing protein n=1 Tax=Rugamonas apoptosis TaxID=2758570 RepID=A0A7W2F5J0_9BURK|nr:DUF2442 domain-containing protein [Rugamonas apoptosis]MBA5685497.1 DUF2442 domain-containing protein [Rugamonas apoptosis]